MARILYYVPIRIILKTAETEIVVSRAREQRDLR